MEKLKAKVIELDEKQFIRIETGEKEIKIPISEDNANDVKNAFNRLIARIRDGEFQIELEGIGPDLFSQVADEYITQLNREIREVRREMESYKLVDE